MGRGPARPVNFSEDGPRPGPAHHFFKRSRSGPAHHLFKGIGPAQPGPSHGSKANETRALYGPARQFREPAGVVGRPIDLTGRPMGRPCVLPYLKGACADADLKFLR